MVVGFLSWDGAVSEAFLGEQAPRSHRRGYHPLAPEVWLHISLVMTGYAGGAAEARLPCACRNELPPAFGGEQKH